MAGFEEPLSTTRTTLFIAASRIYGGVEQVWVQEVITGQGFVITRSYPFPSKFVFQT